MDRVLLCVTRDEAISILDDIHDDVDAGARRLATTHGARLTCARGCFGCCSDDLTVFAVEAEKIRERHRDFLTTGIPHGAGRCAFLGDAGECRVYESRPYVCRTQGLPLRWLDDDAMVEFRDICELNEAGDPVEALDEEHCWTIGPVELRLARLQAQRDGGAMTRVALRDLFDPD